ncbi:MAG TPA: DUF411 domain-containing protein [Gemmatimonadales bacterium]|nr:DUF411 domain-containing protein [Gemmatimonadales bacterium]
MISRRAFLTRTAGVAALGLTGRNLWAFAPVGAPLVTVYKSPSCGCCAKWVSHLEANGFQTAVHDRDSMDEVKDGLGVPNSVRSCHTAQVNGYLIEGHVPAGDITRLIAERPKVSGLAVPGMPHGTPGMAAPGAPHEPFEVVAFQSSGATQVFARH